MFRHEGFLPLLTKRHMPRCNVSAVSATIAAKKQHKMCMFRKESVNIKKPDEEHNKSKAWVWKYGLQDMRERECGRQGRNKMGGALCLFALGSQRFRGVPKMESWGSPLAA